MAAIETRITEAASEVAKTLLSLVQDVGKEGHDDVARLLGRVQHAFEDAAPASVHVFNDLGDDLEGVYEQFSTTTTTSSSDEPAPPPPSPKRRRRQLKANRRKEWEARRAILNGSSSDSSVDFEQHRYRTGYSHWRDCTMPATKSEEELFKQGEERQKNAKKQRTIKYGDAGCPIVLTDSQ